VSWVTSNQRHAALGVLGEQQIDDLLAGGFVEISGRLVRHQDGGIGASARAQCDALLLAAGQLRGIMMQPVAEADGCEFLRGAFRRSGLPASSSAPRHSPARSWWDEMKRLEDDADMTAANRGQRVLVEGH